MTVRLRRALLACLLASAPARAQTAAPTQPHVYSPYELETIRRVQRTFHAAVDPAPEGKIIEAIDVVPLEVIEDRDLDVPDVLLSAVGLSFVPDLNALHATSRPYVIRREVLQGVGSTWSGELADETARNLRALPQLSLVIVAAFRGSRPDRVRLVVITKDVWSLRLGSAIGLSSAGLESLLLEPTESNLGGTHELALARFTYRPLSYSLGATYREGRLHSRHYSFTADANVVFNTRSGQAEGSFGSVAVARPLWSTHTEWGWGVNTVWDDEVQRHYVGTRVQTYDAAVTPNVDDRIPYEYRSRYFTETAALTRSFGVAYKNDFSIGAEMNIRTVRDEFDAGTAVFNPAAVDEFNRTLLPVGDTRVGPFVQWRSYTTRFLRAHDIETLALEEDIRLGHDVWVKVYPVTRFLGSTRDFFGTYAAAQYTVPIADGFARASVELLNELEASDVSDAAVSAELRIVSPEMPFGRLVSDAAVLNRYRNYLNRIDFLGGNTRLRGYPSNFFAGKDLAVYNLELRTRPVQVLRFQIGAAIFYDVGDAMQGFDRLTLHDSAGFGLRTLFPQVERFVLRTDVAFPLERPLPAGVAPWAFFFSFEQAFGLATVGNSAAQGIPSTVGALNQ